MPRNISREDIEKEDIERMKELSQVWDNVSNNGIDNVPQEEIEKMKRFSDAWDNVIEGDISNLIRKRIQEDNVNFNCNDNIADYIREGELNELQKEVEQKFKSVLDSLVIDTNNDPNTNNTAHRVAKMFINELFSGRYYEKPKTTSFPNHQTYDELYASGPISIRSTCAHHFAPIKGNCWIGVFPGSNVIGLSKFNRIVDWLASRPTIQEELTVQIADEIEKETQAKGVGVVVKAEHHCLIMRGVKEPQNDMTTSVMRGALRENNDLKREFFELLSGMKGY